MIWNYRNETERLHTDSTEIKDLSNRKIERFFAKSLQRIGFEHVFNIFSVSN